MYLIAHILDWLLLLMGIAIFVRGLFSWIDPTGRSAFGQILARITDPVIQPIRRVMPNTGMIDLSPFVAIIIIYILRQLLASVA